MRHAWLTVLSAALSAALAMTMSACGGATAEPVHADSLPSPEEPLVMEGDAGRYGGRFIAVGNGTPETFNPVMASSVPSNELGNQLFVRLTRLDGITQQNMPLLATKWEVSSDGLTWTFHLRHGAAFSDGHPLTAADVVFSFAAIYDPKIPASQKDQLSTNGRPWTVVAPDPYTVTITTATPNVVVPELAGSVRILPRHVLGTALEDGTLVSAYALTTPPDKLVTSGPWKLSSYTHRERTVLVRNPYWFGVDAAGRRLPYLDELVVIDVPEQNTANLKFQAGEVDALPNALAENYAWYEQHASQGHFTLHDVGPSLAPAYLWFNLKQVTESRPSKPAGSPEVDAIKYAWFSKADFRRAVSMAIDREAMIGSVYFGAAVRNWSTATPGNRQWYTPDLAHDDYNPSEAKRLLAGLGFADRDGDGTLEDRDGHPLTFTLKTNSSNLSRVAMANFVRDDLAKVGIRVVLSLIDFNTFITNANRDHQYEAGILGLAFARPDPVNHATLWRSSAMFHQWNNLQPKAATPDEARIDELMDEMTVTLDTAKRMASWRELQTIANRQAWLIWLPVQVVKIPVRDRIGNMQPTGVTTGLAAVAWNSELLYVKSQR